MRVIEVQSEDLDWPSYRRYDCILHLIRATYRRMPSSVSEMCEFPVYRGIYDQNLTASKPETANLVSSILGPPWHGGIDTTKH